MNGAESLVRTLLKGGDDVCFGCEPILSQETTDVLLVLWDTTGE